MTQERLDIIVSEKGSRTVRRNVESIGKSAQKSQSAVSLLSRALTSLAVGAGITSAIRTMAAFSQEMSTVRAIANATESEFAQLRATAEGLGATTRFSATQAAEGMTFLARAGFNANEVLSTIDDTLRLAQAGALDLASAADIASNIMKGFRLDNDQAARAVDVLAFAANNANTNVQQLGEAMKFVAPVAAGLGVSMEESAAAIAALSDAGLQGSLAGTGLRRVLSELESPSTKTEKILRNLGVTTDDVRVSQVGLTNALTTLRDAGVDTGQALEIFGDRGGPAFEVLSSAIPRVVKLTEELRNAEGTAKRIADVMDDNLNGALLAVRSAAESVVLSLGKLGAESTLTNFFRGLAEVLRNVAANLDVVVAGASALATLIALRLTPAIVALTASLLKNPFGLIAVAIGTITVSLAGLNDDIIVFGTNIGRLRALFLATFSFIKDLVASTFNGITEASKVAFDNVPALMKFAFQTGINGVITVMEAGINLISLGLAKIPEAIVEAFKKLPGILGTVFTNVKTTVTSFLTDISNFEFPTFEDLFDLGDNGALVITLPRVAMDKAGTDAAMIVGEAFTGQFDADLRKTLGEGFPGIFKEITKRADVIEQTRNAGTAIGKETGSAVVAAVKEAVVPTSGKASGLFDGLTEQVRDSFLTVNDVVTDSLKSLEDTLVEFTQTGKLSFEDLANSISSSLARIAIQQNITGPLAKLFEDNGSGASSASGFIGNLFSKGKSLLGFAGGGSIDVGGVGGVDNNVLSLNSQPVARVSKGERIDVVPNGGNGSQRPVNITFNISTPNAESFQKSQTQIFAKAQASLQRAGVRNN